MSASRVKAHRSLGTAEKVVFGDVFSWNLDHYGLPAVQTIHGHFAGVVRILRIAAGQRVTDMKNLFAMRAEDFESLLLGGHGNEGSEVRGVGSQGYRFLVKSASKTHRAIKEEP